jgi:hypothetical protein
VRSRCLRICSISLVLEQNAVKSCWVGGLGIGLSRQILDGYKFVRAKWQPGDEVFIFGFSRGAYAARSLASFIGLVGWLDSPDIIDRTYDNWYRHARQTDPDSRATVQETQDNVDWTQYETTRSYLPRRVRHGRGPWGTDILPDHELFAVLRKHLENDLHTIQGFHDTTLGSHINNAYHAVAIDENHEPFEPTLWGKVPNGTVAEETWFAGGHGEIGGGHKGADDNRTLAKVPLLWMMEKIY